MGKKAKKNKRSDSILSDSILSDTLSQASYENNSEKASSSTATPKRAKKGSTLTSLNSSPSSINTEISNSLVSLSESTHEQGYSENILQNSNDKDENNHEDNDKLSTINGYEENRNFQEGELEEEEEDLEEEIEETFEINNGYSFDKRLVKNSGRSDAEQRALIKYLSPSQLNRYEAYKKFFLNKGTVRKIVSTILNQQVSQNLAMVIGGFSKIFIGEIVELALEVKKEWNEKLVLAGQQVDTNQNSPLLPDHLKEAYRRYKANQSVGMPKFVTTQTLPNGCPHPISKRPKKRFFKFV